MRLELASLLSLVLLSSPAAATPITAVFDFSATAFRATDGESVASIDPARVSIELTFDPDVGLHDPATETPVIHDTGARILSANFELEPGYTLQWRYSFYEVTPGEFNYRLDFSAQVDIDAFGNTLFRFDDFYVRAHALNGATILANPSFATMALSQSDEPNVAYVSSEGNVFARAVSEVPVPSAAPLLLCAAACIGAVRQLRV